MLMEISKRESDFSVSVKDDMKEDLETRDVSQKRRTANH
jgi:hypothetical protein